MEAQAWTAIGLCAAIQIAYVLYLGKKIDALGARLNSHIDRLEVKLDDDLRWHAS